MSNTTLDAVLSQYEKNTARSQGTGNQMSQDERMKKYFTTLLDKNSRTGQKRVRILPTSDGSSPFKEVWYHEIQVDGKWVKLYDPGKNDGERSPLTEVYEELIATGKESDKKLAQQYRSRKFYIVKVVDRDAEEDGVKFWRFKDNYKQEGILDKIIPIWKQKGDITNADNGRDLIIEMVKSKTPAGKEYTVVQTIMHDDPTPLHTDEAIKKEWVEDEMTWSDVYSKKPVEYLEAVARGEVPRWDSDLKKYVYGDSVEDMSMGGGSTTSSATYDPQSESEPDEELPF
jgi:hypothetical protein